MLFNLQKKRNSEHLRQALRDLNNGQLDTAYRSTTAYPHPSSGGGALSVSNDDLTFGFNQGSFGQPNSLAYMLPPPDLGGSHVGRQCEIHMNSSFQGGPGMPAGHPGIGRGLSSGALIGHTCTYLLCCGARGLLSKFPSRAKRIDVISRFIFPLIFAIFNLAYWLYYLFAKGNSPQLDG